MVFDVKITVIKKLSTIDLYGNSLDGEELESCGKFTLGQEFIVGQDGNIPKGFCAWAWHDIQREVWTIRNGGRFPWIKKEGLIYSCCTDGLRPVFFKIEKIN
jgi:uncharacterized repeat protein (TIGR04076 family)